MQPRSADDSSLQERFSVSSATVSVPPRLLRPDDRLRGLLRAPGRRRSPGTQTRTSECSEEQKRQSRSASRARANRNSPACPPLRTPGPRPRCRRAARRSAPVCTSSLNRRWPPAVLPGSLPASQHLLCLSPGGPPPEETANTDASAECVHVRAALMERHFMHSTTRRYAERKIHNSVRFTFKSGITAGICY